MLESPQRCITRRVNRLLQMMVRRTSPSCRSPSYPARWPFVPVWAVGVAASGAALCALAYLVGRRSPVEPAGTLDAMLLAASSPGLAIVLTFGALMLGAWSYRHLALHWLAWKPGSIHVSEFTLGSPRTAANAEQLTMLFRRRLASLQIQSPTPMPGAAGASDFLDVLDRGGADARNPLGTLISLLRAARPTHAYEVRGVLLERDEREGCGVAVEVARLPSEGLAAEAVWAETWECALRRAADEATAAILPQTRACRAPWGVWRGYRMPGRLLHAYEEGARLEQERRYDEALESYYDALKDDPINAVLRLRVGQLQERLGLFLDAFATYSGISAGGKPGRVRRPRPMYRGRGRREQRRAQVSARYRRIVLLGGRVLAEQWRKAAHDPERPTERDEQRRRLRQCLRPQLEKKLKPCDPAYTVSGLLDEPRSDDAKLFRALRKAFAEYALRDSRTLRHRMRFRAFDRRATLTLATVRLTEACIQLRLDFVRNRDGEDVRWPPKADELDRRIARIERGPVLARTRLLARLRRPFRHWHEHYNAACVYALPLLVETFEGEAADGLARRAVERLEAATARADSAYIASRRDWLVSEDPDLSGLRAHRRFAEFEVMHLPSASITPQRPSNVQQLESSRYVRRLLSVSAEQWQTVWRERRATINGGPDLRQLLEWFGDELRAWQAVRTVACNYRHSGSRLTLIRNLQVGARRYGRPPPEVAFPRYELTPLDGALAREPCDPAANKEIETGDTRLSELCEIVGERVQAAPALLAGLEDWQATLRRHDAEARRASGALLRRLCDHHAALWQLLGQWIEADDDGAAAARLEFEEKVHGTRRLWRATLGRWGAPSWWQSVRPSLAPTSAQTPKG
jgi:hypothetical protein